MTTLTGKHVLVIGARAGGYGDSIARAALRAGAVVTATTLNPEDVREQKYFSELGADLIPIAVRYDAETREALLADLGKIRTWLTERGVDRLDAVFHTVAGGFPRQPSVMKAVGDILKGKTDFSDMATLVKRNVYYVNAGSFEDTVLGLDGVTDDRTHWVALTYRGELPYFISDTKGHLERIAVRLAQSGKRTLVAALPEAWTQSSQFFTGIEIAVLGNYLESLKARVPESDFLRSAFSQMEELLADLEGFDALENELAGFIGEQWRATTGSGDRALMFQTVQELFGRLRNEGRFPILRRAVEIISDFVRIASGENLVQLLAADGSYRPGDVRQWRYGDLLGGSRIGRANLRPRPARSRSSRQGWVTYDRDEIRKTLKMYGENFLFLDRVVMETGVLSDGGMGFGSYTVPFPEENPIMRDHFVDMPLFGGHLQMEAVAQFGTFMILKCLTDTKKVPILTGTEFPDLNTMAPPGEKLTMMGVIRMHEKRNLTLEASIENRFARSNGIIRGMLVAERVVKKMVSSF